MTKENQLKCLVRMTTSNSSRIRI